MHRRFFPVAAVVVWLAGRSPATAAHEWRADWASPYTLEQAETLVSAPSESVRVELAVARPYGLRELSCGHARVRFRAWEFHAGGLSAEEYREWHLGLGRSLAVGTPAGLLVGARIFGVRAAGEARPARAALTSILRVAPAGLGGLGLEMGVVDAGLSRHPDQPTALLVVRLRAVRAVRSFLLERSISSGGTTETTLAIGYPLGRIRLAHAIRLGTGEGSIVVTLPAGPAAVSVAQRWHPALGWTPAVTVRWVRGG
jgi:hypothetical protein